MQEQLQRGKLTYNSPTNPANKTKQLTKKPQRQKLSLQAEQLKNFFSDAQKDLWQYMWQLEQQMSNTPPLSTNSPSTLSPSSGKTHNHETSVQYHKH